ncbi:transglycosylase domain-containing protein [Bacillus piscicola]|uniref:transglycosylase domain-containing protein n=1 Tax=Bacillus piscicola TaxID=1632684 RepID=UPI001F08FD57|nr:PBP1A family penicillin-binding protein [Bacillus piscicola]
MDTAIRRRNQAPRRIGWFRLLLRFMLFFGILGMSSALAVMASAKLLQPPPIQVDQSTVFYGKDDTIIGEHHNGQQRYWLELDDMAPEIKNAIIAIEDREFYEHFGFDFSRIGSAVAANLQAGAKVQGASTITQQYARNLFLSHDKTWARKIEEAFYALRLESHYSKDKILEGYLNTIYFGHGAYGIEAASRLYFDKSASRLTLAEAALLAGVPKGPSYYSPFSYPERAKERQEIILQAMEKTGAITAEERNEAIKAPLRLEAPGQLADERVGPYFQDHVEKLLEEKYDLDPQIVEKGGLHIYTTLDPDLQETAEKWVRLEIPKDSELQSALVAMDPDSGAVRALVGGKSYEKSTFNRAVHAARPPGSALKPFLYYAALEEGFTPLTAFRSEPTEFEFGENGETYSPGNYGEYYANDFISMGEALAVSDNIFAVKTHLYLGPEALVETTKKAGIEADFSPIPSLALGSQSMRILDLATGYSAIANGGYQVEPQFIEKITDAEGNVLVETEVEKQEVFDPKKTYVLTDMMKGVFDVSLESYTSVTGRSVAHLINRPVAGKSGSTDYDSWMAGFTPQLVTAVWAGYDDNRPMNHAEEGQITKRIWAQFMSEGLEDSLKLSFLKPNGVVEVDIDPETGLLASKECGASRTIAFEKGTEPRRSCTDELEKKTNNEEKEKMEEELEAKEEKFWDRFKRWFE